MSESDIVGDPPTRSYMDDPNIKWDAGKPDFSLVDKKYMAERSKQHKTGSLEKLVENLVKTWEMEVSHKVDIKDWCTIDSEKFTISVNGGKKFKIDEYVAVGNYRVLLETSPLYDISKESKEESQLVFKNCFPDGFAWEVLEVYSGPPRVIFKWRHWAEWTGNYRDVEPTGEHIELVGMTIATVDDDLKVTELEVYYDPNPMIAQMTKGKCPFAQ